MADGPEAPTEGIAYRRLFPWVRLFWAFGVASDAKKLILAAERRSTGCVPALRKRRGVGFPGMR